VTFVAEIIVEIDSLDSAGDGMARHRGAPITVPFTIPGERVRVELGPSRDGMIAARLIEVVRASPHRVDPRCSHFGSCGGCAWQHIAYPEQLTLKTQLVTRLVREAVPRAPAARPMIATAPLDDPWGYRHKAHFVFGTESRAGRRDGTLVMGHYARGSRRVVPIHECPVHAERGNAVAFGLFDTYARMGSHSRTDSTLKSVAVRVGCSTKETMATLVVTSETDKRLRAATRQVLAKPWAPSSFHVNIHPRGDAFIFGRETRRITGPERLRENIAGVAFLISPTAFFQTNVTAAEVLVQLVLEAVPATAAVLDLYAGAGLFALPLAHKGRSVVAVEENHAAVADGEASLGLNRIPKERCRFITKPVETVVRRQARATGYELPPIDAVVLDPPREGCEASVLDDVFAGIAPATAVYVSCHPDTLARDLKRIATHGYTVTSIQPVDMFPHTPHIETVVVLNRGQGSAFQPRRT
jgi:23S rRNA (uracil1939-C5)-methyltransferase